MVRKLIGWVLICCAIAPFFGLLFDCMFWVFGVNVHVLNWTDIDVTASFLVAWVFIGGGLSWIAAVIMD